MAIIEIKKIAKLLEHVDEETLVLLDIDNTLIEPIQHVGSVAWFDHLMRKLKAQGMSDRQAGGLIYPVWVGMQEHTTVKTVEPETVSVINQLHAKNIKTMGVTARGFDVAQVTVKHLKSVELSLDVNSIHDQEVKFTPLFGFFEGILFAGPGLEKGHQLMTFFEHVGHAPKKVLFVDDVKRYLDDVQGVLRETTIEFAGLRYGGADRQHMTFDPARADEELKMAFEGTEHEKLIESVL